MKGRGTRSWLERCTLGVAFLMALSRGAMGEEKDETVNDGPRFTEQSIYIPYENLRRVFEKEGRGVFLPYEQFRELWEAAKAKTPERRPDDQPPSPALVSEIVGQAIVDQEIVRFQAKLRLEILKTGWCEVPLRLRDVALTRAQLGKSPARLTYDAGEGYRLIVERTKDSPSSLELELEFAKAYERAPGQNSVSFETPQAPVSRWDITIPEPGVKVHVHPLLAAAERPSQSDKGEKTCVQAFVGAAPTVRFEWTPKSEGAKGMEALAQVEAAQGLVVDEGVLHVKARLTYAISRAALSSLELRVPPSFRIVNVYDPNVREWSVEAGKNGQSITVQLFEAAQGSQSLLVELERFFEKETEKLEAPVIQALHVGRQQGVVAVRASQGLRLEATERIGLTQLSEAELPASLRNESWSASYRYSTVPYQLTLSLESVKPRILAKNLVLAHVTPESVWSEARVLYDVQRAGVFQLALSVPPGFEVRGVKGVTIGDAGPVQVQAHHVTEGERGRRLVVDLSEKALNRVAMVVTLHKDLVEPDLLRPTGRAVSLALPLPRVHGVEREEGSLVVCGKLSLRIQAEDTTGLRPISFAEATKGFSAGLSGGETASLVYAFGQTEATIQVAAERRRPYVTVGQLLSVRVEAGVAKFEDTLFYEVLYSGVEGLHLDVPEALAEDKIRLITPGFERQQVTDGEEEGESSPVPPGYVRWKLTGGSEISGSGSLQFAWEEKIEKLSAGKSTKLSLPRLRPSLVNRSWGQIVLSKAETTDVAPTDPVQGLRPIDPQTDLMRGIQIPGAARAYEFHDDWKLSLQVTRYELKEVKATSVEEGLVRMVLTRGGSISVQAIYRVKSARQRLAIQLPGEVTFDSQPARINGTAIVLEEGEGQFHVPLTAQDPETPFLLELRYVAARSTSRLECPSFPEGPATQRVYLSLYLPQDRDFLGYWGPWTDENTWRVRGFSVYPRASMNDAGQIKEMARGLQVDPASLLDFPTEGSQLLFSALRPPSGGKGALRLFSLKRWLFKGIVLAMVLGCGLILLRFSFKEKTMGVGTGVIAMVFLAIFFPTLARQVADGVLAASVLVVLVIWALWYFLVTRSNDPDVQAKRARRKQRRKTPPPLRRSLDQAWKDAEAAEKNEQNGQNREDEKEEGGRDDA